ncbi:MAG: SUF system NifU family Fe-S cluster assembly protein [Gammaproteobacteria bacterium]|nr:SUF system NifU family Fe-S cluster assembly protein [Gammaproteobacteria bacterium]
MSDSTTSLTDLYRQTVLNHSRNPHNCRRPAAFDREAEGHNALCGDKVHVYLCMQGQALADVAYEASGCAISMASASMMSDAVAGKTVSAARQTIDDFMGGLSGLQQGRLEGELAALGGVRDYPSRIRCATLPWQTLRAALDAVQGTVTTE